MSRLMDWMVRSGLVTACRFAGSPIIHSPVLEKATMEGVVRPPCALGIMTGSVPSHTAIQELVVPRSIPMILAILLCSFVL